MTEYIQVVTTTDSEEEAKRIGRSLVEKRLAACVQIAGAVASTYWWKEEIETAEEWQCWAKSRQDLYEELEQTIKEVHSYEVPEILAVPVLAGSENYLAWMDSQLGNRPQP